MRTTEPTNGRTGRIGVLVAIVALLAGLLPLGVIGPSAASAATGAGVPPGTALTAEGSLKVVTNGTVVDARAVDGQIVVQANNVTIKRTSVTYGGYHAIRVMSGYSGTVVEDVSITCTNENGKGVVFGDYVARRVDVTGCKAPFVQSTPAIVEDSFWNGEPVGQQTTPPPPTTPPPTTPPPTTPPPTTPPPTTPPPTTPPPTTPPPTTPPPTTPPPTTPPPTPIDASVQWATNRDRTSPKDLQGATVSGGISVFLDLSGTGVQRVEWTIDGLRYRADDLYAPYDLVPAGSGKSGMFDTKTLANGQHTVSALVVTPGEDVSTKGTFTVKNESSITPPPTTPPPTTPPPTTPPPTTPPPTTPPPEGMPTEQSIISGAGLSDPSALRPAGSVTASTNGQVVQNLDISGVIVVKADDVKIRNVRVSGNSSTALVKIEQGASGTVIEDCEIHVDPNGANGGIGYLGEKTTVRRCEISGYADGIKAEDFGLYEYNYIHMYKPAGSAKHLDGIQGSSDTDYTIRRNVIRQPIASGGNSAVFVQAWNGANNYNVYNVVVEENYVQGGNYTVYLEGGKDNPGDACNLGSCVHNYRLSNNVFVNSGYRYGLLRIANCAQTSGSGNVIDTGGTVGVC